MLESLACTAEVRTVESRNAYGEPVYSTESSSVDVLIDPGSPADLGDERPEGSESRLTLHWPWESCGMELKGALVELPGEWAGTYRVVGDPMPYPEALCPPAVRFRMPVEVERIDG